MGRMHSEDGFNLQIGLHFESYKLKLLQQGLNLLT